MRLILTDAGRAEAGYDDATAADCVCRSIVLATGRPYREVYERLAAGVQEYSPRYSLWGPVPTPTHDVDGVVPSDPWFRAYMRELGFHWVPTSGRKGVKRVYMREDSLPEGEYIVSISQHYAFVRDKVLYDTFDSSNEGKMIVYGYWQQKEDK